MVSTFAFLQRSNLLKLWRSKIAVICCLLIMHHLTKNDQDIDRLQSPKKKMSVVIPYAHIILSIGPNCTHFTIQQGYIFIESNWTSVKTLSWLFNRKKSIIDNLSQLLLNQRQVFIVTEHVSCDIFDWGDSLVNCAIY